MNAIKCPKCNTTDHETGAKYCHVCGELLPPSAIINTSHKKTLGLSDLLRSKTFIKWIAGIIIMSSIIALCALLGPKFINKNNSKKTVVERTISTGSYPQDISGNYFVRMMNGRENVNASIKIYNEGGEYAMNVYSSNITKKYTFSYNSSNGEIISQELGRGTVRIKELTNEIEITFEGWELVK